MFNRKKKQEQLIAKLSMIKPTSKEDLKRQCLYLSNLDVDKAERMYDFLVKDMEGIPDIPPATRPFIQNFGDQANGVIGWFRENKDVIGEVVDFVKNIIASRNGTPPAAPLPPING